MLSRGALLGAVRWSPTSSVISPLYSSLLGGQSYILASQNRLHNLLTPARDILPHVACWLPVFATNHLDATTFSHGGQHKAIADGLAVISDQNGASALAADITVWQESYYSELQGPFVSHNASLPAPPGALCWLDLMTPNDVEDQVSQEWSDVFNWRIGKTIEFPAPSTAKYITLMDGPGQLNRNKLGGVLPRASWPMTKDDVPSQWVTFFSAPHADAVHSVEDKLKEFGASILVPPMDADGTVAICRDEQDAIFGYYHRTDPPDEIKC